MKNKGKSKVELTSVEELFSTEESRQDAGREKVIEVPLSELFPFPDHPFNVRDDESMKQTVRSIKANGILTPLIVRPREEGGYQIISGHRRKHASELAGLETVPVIVREIDMDAAIISMVDSNLQREEILPSERARAYKMKLEAMKHQGERQTLTSAQVEQKSKSGQKPKWSVEQVAAEAGESRAQAQRYIRLNALESELLDMVDSKKIGLTPAVEISFLKPEEQGLLLTTMESEQTTPSLSQAQRMRKLSQVGKLNEDSMLAIMMEVKKPEQGDIVIPREKIKDIFPEDYTPKDMERTILELLERWGGRRRKEQEQIR